MPGMDLTSLLSKKSKKIIERQVRVKYEIGQFHIFKLTLLNYS